MNQARELPCLLRCEGLSRRIKDRCLLDRIDLEIRAGERIAVVGPSGSGKSLLLRALSLLDPHDSGEVLWRGSTVDARRVPAMRAEAIYLHQRPVLAEGTVEACLREPFGFAVHRQRSWNREWAANWLSSKLGRDPGFLDQETRELSGGETQIVALLRAIQLEPAVLFLDEPTSALDADTTHGLEQLVRQWFEAAPDRRAYVWVTHDPTQATRIADRTLAMRQGRLEAPTRHE